MRALGPGSVSSLLKVILDVVRVVLWISAVGVAVAIVAVLLLSFKPELLRSTMDLGATHIDGPWIGPMLAATLAGADLYLGGAIVVVGRLRRIFQTLIAGDPFHPDNVRRLRVIGVTLAVLEISRYCAAGLPRLLLHGQTPWRVGGGVSFTTWFAVLVIVVLAEVFREGARLRGEAELTI